MLEYLQGIDAQWLLAINGWHGSYMDSFMWLVSKPLSWTLIGIAAIYVTARRGWRSALLLVLAIGLAVLVADQVSSHLIKPLVERLRPTHEPSLEGLVHVVRDYRGGMYGFVSSHAANAFAIALLLGMIMPRRVAMWALMAWACLQCYSRMYLGVHYPGDILGGMVVGLLAGAVAYWLWRKAVAHVCPAEAKELTQRDSQCIALAVLVTVIVEAAVAIFY